MEDGLNIYLPTVQAFYETKESKYVYHLRCPDSKYTFYWDADIVVAPEIAFPYDPLNAN